MQPQIKMRKLKLEKLLINVVNVEKTFALVLPPANTEFTLGRNPLYVLNVEKLLVHRSSHSTKIIM